MDRIITSTGKQSTQRKAYLHKLAGETLIGAKEEGFSSPAMLRGTELEDTARQLFSMVTGHKVNEVGLCYENELKLWHVSPDGLIDGQKKGLEIKCPLLSTAVEYLDAGKLPTKYKIQVQASLALTGYESWFFMSFYPGLKPFIVEVERDEVLIAAIKKAVGEFCLDLRKLVEKLS
jgi:predicted phage-related endonuclease